MVTTWWPASASTGTNRSNDRQLADKPCTHRMRGPSGSPFDSKCMAPDDSWIRLAGAISRTRNLYRLARRGRELVAIRHDAHPVDPLVGEDAHAGNPPTQTHAPSRCRYLPASVRQSACRAGRSENRKLCWCHLRRGDSVHYFCSAHDRQPHWNRKFQRDSRRRGRHMKSGSKIRRSGSSSSNAGSYINPHLALCRGFPNSENRGDTGATPSRSTIGEIVNTPCRQAGRRWGSDRSPPLMGPACGRGAMKATGFPC